MTVPRDHYERAFAHYMRARRVPCIAIDEARRSLLPALGPGEASDIKSFDFLVHGASGNLIVDVKGRRLARTCGRRLESWVTEDDVSSLRRWGELFGERFTPTFVFLYWCDAQPPDGLYQEVFAFEDRWYAVRSVDLRLYERWMTARSPRWRTVHIPSAAFERISQPFLPPPSEARAPSGSIGPLAALQPLPPSISSCQT